MTSKRKENYSNEEINEKRARLQKELTELEEIEQSACALRMKEQMKEVLKNTARVLQVAKKIDEQIEFTDFYFHPQMGRLIYGNGAETGKTDKAFEVLFTANGRKYAYRLKASHNDYWKDNHLELEYLEKSLTHPMAANPHVQNQGTWRHYCLYKSNLSVDMLPFDQEFNKKLVECDDLWMQVQVQLLDRVLELLWYWSKIRDKNGLAEVNPHYETMRIIEQLCRKKVDKQTDYADDNTAGLKHFNKHMK